MSRGLASTMMIVTFLAALAACGDGRDDGDGGAPPAATTSTTEAAGDEVGGLDFANGSEVTLADGWTISPCESGAPLFCARLDGETDATISLRTAPAASYETIRAALEAGRSPLDALRAEAGEFVSVFEEDRPVGCGPDYGVAGFGPDEATIGGRPGIVYGFDGTQGGRHVERALQFMTLDGPDVHLISVNGIDDGSCMDDGELAEFTIAELTELEPTLAKVFAASTLP
jgi:hypothetical protein